VKKVLVINGPNLNLLGKREPLLYGDQSFDAFLDSLHAEFAEASITCGQYNDEGALIHALHQAMDGGYAGVVLNAAAYSHTSIAVGDAVSALRAVGVPVVEVHISNVLARDAFRHHSYVGRVASGSISGLGLAGYRLAISWLLQPN
jgi:3-dehydroquinate dehydratase-2